MPVFVGDKTHGALMIKKVGASWCVYILKEVRFKYASYDTTFGHKYKNVKWIFETKPRWTHGYKPFDDDDVTSNPNILIDFVARWSHHKMRQML